MREAGATDERLLSGGNGATEMQVPDEFHQMPLQSEMNEATKVVEHGAQCQTETTSPGAQPEEEHILAVQLREGLL